MMPTKLFPLCQFPGGCQARAIPAGKGRCAQHQQPRLDRRGSARSRGYDTRWDVARRSFLTHWPLCAACLAAGRTTRATVVDHIRPHRGDPERFWDTDNWQALCATCHNKKTGGGR